MLILSVQDVKPCGVQRPQQQPTFGFEYRGQCFDFVMVEWMDYGTAIDHCRTLLDDAAHPDVLICLLSGAQGYRLCRHDQGLKRVSIQTVLQTLCEQMAAEPGFVDSRRWRLRMFDKCFVGRDAVTWIERRLQIPRNEALKIGRVCVKSGLFSHVLGEQEFADEHYFYRFRWDGDPENRIVPDLNTFKPDLGQIWGGPGAEHPPEEPQDPGLEPHPISH